MSSLNPFNNVLVRRFLNWKQGDEDDTWRTKAVDALTKKLKKNPEQYNNLVLVLRQKSDNTPCVTLSRSQDGRLQVSHRKMLPHVMYCRIFRWPDLQSQHELKSVIACQFPAHRRESNKICVNPYHYARVDHSLYPPVVTPRSTEFVEASPPPESPLSPGTTYSTDIQNSPTSYFNPTPVHPQPPRHHSFQPQPIKQDTLNDPFQYANNQQSQMTAGYYASQSPVSESNWYNGTGAIQQYESQSPPPGYTINDQQQQQQPPPPQQQPLALMPMDTGEDTQHTNIPPRTDEAPVPWCRIAYAELGQKIGEPFKGSSPKVIVDGFTDPSVHNRRFSLGVLSNINRNSTIEMTRRAIRKGVCLENNDSQIYVKNLSESPIFYHSKNCNVENQLNQFTVVKIDPQARQKIFDQKVFENLVQEAIRCPDGKTYERLFSLTDHCIIKMSFVKGWGSLYHRQDVTSTPCWIEIHLLKPYALIDQYLQTVGPPSCQITSTS